MLATFFSSGTWRRLTTAKETKLLMLRHILHIPYLNDIRDADSCSGRTLTDNWWANGFGTELKSATTGPASTSKAPQGSNLALFRTASAAVTAVFSMLIPVSEKELLCVNKGWRIKSCTHATAPFTFSWSMAIPFSDTVKRGSSSEKPRTTNAVNWKI